MYAEMNSSELLRACGDSGEKWADAFMEIVGGKGLAIDADLQDVLRAWFANAIEHSNDVRRWRREAEAK